MSAISASKQNVLKIPAEVEIRQSRLDCATVDMKKSIEVLKGLSETLKTYQASHSITDLMDKLHERAYTFLKVQTALMHPKAMDQLIDEVTDFNSQTEKLKEVADKEFAANQANVKGNAATPSAANPVNAPSTTAASQATAANSVNASQTTPNAVGATAAAVATPSANNGTNSQTNSLNSLAAQMAKLTVNAQPNSNEKIIKEIVSLAKLHLSFIEDPLGQVTPGRELLLNFGGQFAKIKFPVRIKLAILQNHLEHQLAFLSQNKNLQVRLGYAYH